MLKNWKCYKKGSNSNERNRNDKALIKYLEGQKTSGAAFDNTVYESYDAWIETIRKQIKKSESTLTNIEFKKGWTRSNTKIYSIIKIKYQLIERKMEFNDSIFYYIKIID